MFYIVEVYTPKTVGIYCTDDIPAKDYLYKAYGKSMRILTGPFEVDGDAMRSIPEAKKRSSEWNATSPIFYQPPPEVTYVSSMAGVREKEKESDKAVLSFITEGIDF